MNVHAQRRRLIAALEGGYLPAVLRWRLLRAARAGQLDDILATPAADDRLAWRDRLIGYMGADVDGRVTERAERIAEEIERYRLAHERPTLIETLHEIHAMPSGWPDLCAYLFELGELGVRIPTSARQILRILRGQRSAV